MSDLYKIIIAAGAFVLLILGWQWRESVVYGHGHAAAIAERQIDDDKHLAEATAKALAGERALKAKFDSDALDRAKEKAKYETDLDVLRAAARSGAIRLRAPVACVRANPAPADPAAAGGSGQPQDADLVPAAADDVLRIAGRIAQDVRDYNALINAYQAAVATCNAP